MKHKNLNDYLRKMMFFSKWSRKNNSVFLSIGRLIKISTLSASYFLLNAFILNAQTDTLKIDEINISAYRTKVTFANAPRMIDIISFKDISDAPVISINDALKSIMNVDVRERGAYGIQSDLNIRGGSFEQNVVLINGVRMNDPQTGHFQMNLPIDLEDIQRIELLNGSSSSIYGNNAFSGAINVITGHGSENSIKVSLMGGEYALYGTNLSLNLSTKKFKNYISASKKVSDGYIENTDFDIFNLFYNSKLLLNSGEFQFQAGYADKSFGANNYYTPVYPNQYEQNKTSFANLSFSSTSKIKYSPSVYWRRNYDRFELFRNNPPAWYTSHNYHMTDVYGAAINTNFNTIFGQSAFGIDWNNESILSNKLGEPLNDTIKVKGETNALFTRGKDRQNISSFFENQIELKKIRISARIMANYSSMFDWNFYPGIDMLYIAKEKLRFMASANWSGRLPSYTDLYYVGPSNKGNIKLSPEKATTYEIGAKYIDSSFLIQSAVFYRQGKDIIDWTKENPDSLWQSSNITHLNSYGYEFSAKWNLKSSFGEDFFIKTINLNYSYINADKSSDNYISKYALDYLKHDIGFSLTHVVYKKIIAGWQYNYQLRNGTYLPYNQNNKVYEPAQEYQPIHLLDLKIAYQGKSMELWVQAKNIFDIEQQNIENVRLPGRWISGGVILRLDLFKGQKQ
jgi:iron complex outermembrane receptor protein